MLNTKIYLRQNPFRFLMLANNFLAILLFICGVFNFISRFNFFLSTNEKILFYASFIESKVNYRNKI